MNIPFDKQKKYCIKLSMDSNSSKYFSVCGRLSKVNPKYAIGWTVLDRNTSVGNMAHYLVNMLHKNLIGNNTTCHFLLDWDWARCTLSSHKICGEVRRVQFLKVEQAYFISMCIKAICHQIPPNPIKKTTEIKTVTNS